MRDILFRGKAIGGLNAGRWIYGYYVKDFWAPSSVGHGIIPADRDIGGYCEVYPDTVGQYTGLTDKSGKKIFEGDIVICRQEINGNFIDEHIVKGYVEMKHGAFGLHREQGYYRPFKDWLEDYEYEVTGNIHDNPGLIRGRENA